MPEPQDTVSIYTIGHGRHPFAYFLELLRQHEIKFVCDVRAFARSRWPHFNGLVLHELLNENGIGYEHLPETGGKLKPKTGDPPPRPTPILGSDSDSATVLNS